MRFSDLSIKKQLQLAIGLLLVLLISVGALAVYLLNDINSHVADLAGRRFQQFENINNLLISLGNNSKCVRSALLLKDETQIAKQYNDIAESQKIIANATAELDKSLYTDGGRQLFNNLTATQTNYTAALEHFIALAKNPAKKEDALQYLAVDFRAIQHEYEKSAGALKQHITDHVKQSIEDTDASISVNSYVISTLSVLGSIVGAFVGIMILRLLFQRLGGDPYHATEITRQIANGNLSTTIELKPGDNSSLLASIKTVQEKLQVIFDIRNYVGQAVRGDFTQQIDLSGKYGFELEISESLNLLNAGLLDKIGGNPDEAVMAASRIAAGDLESHVPVRADDNGSILAEMSAMRNNLQMIIDDVRKVVEATVIGDFSSRIDETGRQGYAKTLAELLNRLCRTADEGLSDVARLADALAQGDLTQRIDKHYPGLFGKTANSINSTRDNLSSMISDVNDSVNTIHNSAVEIATGNLDLSQRTEQHAASLEQTASSMEQLASTVKQNADNARLANQLAMETSAVALKGGAVVGEVVSTMNSIQASSNKVVDIIGVIDSLAFQTNILALNAAVEAARAGEQGRGFAVVASEVRSLAQRSAEAAKEIKQLISDSVEKVESGHRQVEDAGHTMNEIVTSVRRVTDIMSEISAASAEQSSGIDQINLAISQMDAVTQQNAALVEEAAGAAETLEHQARNLRNLVSVFQLK
ncbi:methyl-accepting chemotaxis protein [Candidatus Methylospira mobilis]|nr:methyl-accepting chemotaxis protein [Candidatus Methylospira mobilis]WNV05453.1 methyl-accepting chemotaxis protein [Candidatus Methylospira mobilis]